MFDPITMSEELKETYLDYITTTFDMADPGYKQELLKRLREPGAVARGPYLDIGGSYETGHTLRELIAAGSISPLFSELEPVAEENRELKLDRPLYLHQETALLAANAGKNLVVTTGTGSGKTESFLLPILEELLQEEAAGTLGPGVRAMLIYPMNALANDQMKRMRALLKGHPAISYGVYNGDTEHSQSRALERYRGTYRDSAGNPIDPAQNEFISREVMQKTPPHILVTNYSMLEYMMLRPKDDRVFSGASLRYIVLDEAHIYKGATGIETSLLLRRLRARIHDPERVQYLLTSATLGGPEDDNAIIQFAERLCGASFRRDGIIRSTERRPHMLAMLDFPPQLYEELDDHPEEASGILARYKADFAPESGTGEKLYAHFLHCRLFDVLRRVARTPVTTAELYHALSTDTPMTQRQATAFISVCARAERDGASLIKPRYHFFVRALEGAYVTLTEPKKLFLQRKLEELRPKGEPLAVFEAAVCTDCGRLAVAGREERGYLRQSARQGNDAQTEYYCLVERGDGSLLDEETEENKDSAFVLCPICGAIGTAADARIRPICEHDPDYNRALRKVVLQRDGAARCPACGFGRFRRFYLGSEAATAVLGTELFEQLPREESVVSSTAAQSATAKKSVFSKTAKPRVIRKERKRQFLCFSDSRSEAAFFASYMERSYQEFLRRRGIWHTAEKMRDGGRSTVSVKEFAEELSRYFEANRSFAAWDDEPDREPGLLGAVSRGNAWVAILNEMFSARRATSLVSLGVLSFSYTGNDDAVEGFQEAYGLPPDDARDLLDLLAQDAVFSGAIDAGKAYSLNDEEREYIFFSHVSKKLVKLRTADLAQKSALTGWRGRKRANGNFYPNTKLLRLVRALGISEEEADELLGDYWDNVFKVETEEFVLDAADFRVRLGGTPAAHFYRCQRCGRVTPFSVKGQCSSVKCQGTLEPCDPLSESSGNHYAKLYRSNQTDPLFIKEHTAQLSREQQTIYQNAFVQKKINALSCSTTFEMGVDLGSLETVYLRDVPPSPANYVQRAGRAGRSRQAAAFVLTYAKLSSHDFTYYQNPAAMISGKIKAPVFEIENEKILNRHIFAVALSSFFNVHQEVYDGDNLTALVNENGYETLKEYLAEKPESLKELLLRSIPRNMHDRLGLEDYSWTERLCGENGALEIAVQDFRQTVKELEKELAASRRRKDDEAAGSWSRSLRNFRCGREDNCGKKSLISFLVRNNVLPKYGFPVDTVELIPDLRLSGKGKSLQLARDLQLAIAEYAPGAEVVADGKMYVSRFIRKLPGKNAGHSWETGLYCPHCPSCGQPNFTKEPIPSEGRECVSCHQIIKRFSWRKTLEPRMGFCAEKEDRPVPMHRPEHDYKTDDCYIGDPYRNLIRAKSFSVNGQTVRIESTSNDSLVVIGQTDYRVCPVCGYAKEQGIPLQHPNMRGYTCVNQEGKGTDYLLSHDFKTDVAKITFSTVAAADWDTMCSVLYALLEGLSREMDIERTDIKGCLFSTFSEGMMLYSVVLYDAVAGGAGHVRRLVTENGAAFQRVLRRALSVVEECGCDSSCYHCLRNYYNQKLHDILDRKKAVAFLREWMGELEPIEASNL